MQAVAASSDPKAASSGKDAQYAATALRELGKRAGKPGSPVEAALINAKAIPALLGCLTEGRNAWSQRAAAKALCFLQRKERLVSSAAPGVTYASIQQALDAAGKGDFVCARWAKESAKWQASYVNNIGSGPVAGGQEGATSQAPRRKKWYED